MTKSKKEKKTNSHAKFISTLPIYGLSKKELKSLLSPVEMFKRMKENNKIVLSFSAQAHESYIADSKQRFISHFKYPGINIKEMPSCLAPSHCRMNMTLSLDLFDAFEMFTSQELLDEFKKYEKTLVVPLETMPDLIVVGMSKQLKSVLMLYSDTNNKMLLVDNDTKNNDSFSIKSLGYFISTNFTGYFDARRQWFPQDWNASKKRNFTWLDNIADAFYYPLTYQCNSPFHIDMPAVSSFSEMALLQPIVEMNNMNHYVSKAKLELDDAQKKYEASKSLIDKVLIAYDMQVEK